MKSYKYILEGLDCANCAKKIEDKIANTKGYEQVNVNFSTLKLSFQTDKEDNVKQEITQIVHSLEPEVNVIDEKEKITENSERNNSDIFRLIIGVIIYVLGAYVSIFSNFVIITTIISLIILLSKTAKKAFTQVFKNKVLDENTLITISVIGACLVGKSMEGVMVIVLYEIGKILEARAVNKTRKSISDLMDIKPEYANLKKGDEIEIVEPSEVKVGDIVVAKQGEKIPLDGVVVKGTASLNTASLTGESKSQDVDENDIVLSGSIVLEGLLEIKVTEKYENSTVSKILELVENATDKKAKTETFVNKAAKIYTPIVIGIAILVGIFLPLISNVTYGGENGSIYRALIFLVISCPCAIAISVPLCYFSGIGKSSKEGILIKGSDYLDELKDVKEIVFDKTGTLTKGQFGISKIEVYSDKYMENDVLKYVVWGESYSNHPIAKSIVRNAKNVETKKVENYEEITGKGIKYNIDGKTVLAGNSSLVEKEDEVAGSTKIYLKIDDELVGAILLKDEAKHGTKEAIQALNSRGIVTKMFTGDNKKAAKQIAAELGISKFEAEMLPDQKYSELEKELEKYKGTNGKVAFVGDGINDSPVLARADVGISMGGVGSGSAIEASDIVVMTDSIDRIDCAIDISKKTSKIIKQNLIFSIGVKIVVLILSVFGVANMWEAVFADVGATLITVLNSLRILK